MKRYIFTSTCLTALLFIGICLFSGCSDEEPVGPGKEKGNGPSLSILAAVNTGIQTRTTDDPATDVRNQNGSWIKELTIFLFATDATNNDKPLFTKNIQVSGNPAQLNQANEMQLTAGELRQAGIGFGSHVTIYAIANHTIANAADLTKQQVIAQTSTLPEYKQAGAWGMSVVPMTGINPNYKITSADNQTISLDMQRAVIRITVTITDAEFDNDKYQNGQYSWGINSVILYNDFVTTYLWNDGIPANPDCRAENKGIGKTADSYPSVDNMSVGPFYLNCNEISTTHTVATPIKVKVKGSRFNEMNTETPFEYTVDLKKSDGSYSFERNTDLKVNLKLKAGSVEVKTEPLPWDGEVDADGAEKPLRIEPEANSYIVKPGKTILIPISQVQEANAFNNKIATIAVGEKLAPELVWTEVKGTTSGKGLASDASVASIEVLGDGPDAFLRVVTGTQAGNSLIAVKNADGTVKWSWHIWVTDYDPEVTNFVNSGFTFMDRNLGAKTNQPSSSGDNSNGVVGTYYQWGRPTAFPPRGTGNSGLIPTYKADGSLVTINPDNSNGYSITDISDIIPHPYGFIVNRYAGTKELWGSGNTKIALDPCPPGWRLPGKSAWDGVTFEKTHQTSGVNSDAGFYPTSRVIAGKGIISGDPKAFFWTATPYNDNSPYCFSGSAIAFHDMADYFGLPVRCVKE